MFVITRLVNFFVAPDKQLVSKVRRLGLTEVSVFGAGELGMAVVDELLRNGVKLKHWYDSSVSVGEHAFMGQKVSDVTQLSNEPCHYVLLASEAFVSEMADTCKRHGFSGEFIRLEE